MALLTDGRALGLSLGLGGATYVVFLVVAHPRIDAAAPIVALLLILCSELAAWSLDERWHMRADAALVWRRAVAVGLIAFGGLVLATLVVVLTAAPPAHGLAWTIAGAVAAVAAAGTAIHHARR